MHTGSTLEQLTALVVAAEHNARLRENSRCNNLLMEPGTGEVAYQCGSSDVKDPLLLPFCRSCLEKWPGLGE
jgi:hypothetical protein